MKIVPHQGTIDVGHSFRTVSAWLGSEETKLRTNVNTEFSARAAIAQRGSHAGEATIRFFQKGREFARAYDCCWGHYYNCNRTRIGMYCQALDAAASD
jgi:hypothetical protein